MSSLTEFVTKPDWCGCGLNNRITDNDQGNCYISGWMTRSWMEYALNA